MYQIEILESLMNKDIKFVHSSLILSLLSKKYQLNIYII